MFAGAALAGLVQGVAGFGFGLVAAVFWTHGLPPVVEAPLVVACSLAGQLQAFRGVLPQLDRRQAWRLAWPMAAGGVAGLPLGIALLPLVDAPGLRLGIGVLLCVYCPAMLALRRLPELDVQGRWADAAAGAVGGVLGGLAALPGPVPTVWCSVRRWSPANRRIVLQLFLVIVQAAGLAGYAAAGLVTAEVLGLAAWLLPVVLVASVAGVRLYGRLDASTFRRVVLGLLGLTGLVLVADGLGLP